MYNLDATYLGFEALDELVQRREYNFINPVTHSLTTASKVPFFMTKEGRMLTGIEAQMLDGMMVGLLTNGTDALKNHHFLRNLFAFNKEICDKIPMLRKRLEKLNWAHLNLYPLDSAFVHSKEGEGRDLPDSYGALSDVHLATAPFVLGLDGRDIASRMILNDTLDRIPLRVIPDRDQIFSPRLQKEISLMYGANPSLHELLNQIDQRDAQVERTIFGEIILNGEGHRWTTAPRPTLEYLGRLLGEQTRQGMEKYGVLSPEEIEELRSIK